MQIRIGEKFYLKGSNFPYMIETIDDTYITYRRLPDRMWGRDNSYKEKRVYKTVFMQDLDDGLIIPYDSI